eukprot:COSAG01_NODE_9828_length_2330_cov_1.979830_2_plen_31_part_00
MIYKQELVVECKRMNEEIVLFISEILRAHA